MSTTTLPLHAVMTFAYISIAYTMSDQPLEFQRIAMFLLICTLTAFISESFGLMISSVLNLVVRYRLILIKTYNDFVVHI